MESEYMFFHAKRVHFKIFSYSQCDLQKKYINMYIKIFISTSLNKKILLSIFIIRRSMYCYFHHTPYERDILEHVLEFIDVPTNINDK